MGGVFISCRNWRTVNIRNMDSNELYFSSDFRDMVDFRILFKLIRTVCGKKSIRYIINNSF